MAFLVLAVIISALMTFELSKFKYLNSVSASAVIGILSFIICEQLGVPDHAHILYGASFVGMSSVERINRIQVILASVLYFFVFYMLKSYFIGFGGLLGMSAFIAVVLLYLCSSRIRIIK